MPTIPPVPITTQVFQQDGTGAALRLASAKLKERVSLVDFGGVADGTTDNTAAFNIANAAIYAAGGGTLYIPRGEDKYLALGRIILPNDSASTPNQPSIRWVGDGGHFSGQGQAPLGGTILDLRYAGRSFADGVTNTSTTLTSATAAFTANDEGSEVRGTGIPVSTYIVTRNSATSVTLSKATTANATGVSVTVCSPKIVTLGLGSWGIEGITFLDGGSGHSPFILTTNTTIKPRHCAFIGNTPASTAGSTITPAGQDAIILGGTSQNLDGSHNAAFQGYGTVIRDNFFNRIRRLVYPRTFCNGVVIRDNTSWTQCGAGSDAAAIDIDGGTGTDAGNVVVDNTIEMGNYAYGVKAANAASNTLGPNNFYDSGAGVLAYYRMETLAVYNTIKSGQHDAKPFVSQAAGVINEIRDYTAGGTSEYNGIVQFGRAPAVVDSSVNSFDTYSVTGAAGHLWNEQYFFNSINGFFDYFFYYTPSGGVIEAVFSLQRAASGQARFRLLGDVSNRVESAAELGVYSLAGQALYLGDTTNRIYLINGDIAVPSATGCSFGVNGSQKISFHGATAIAKEAVTGSRGGNAALADLLTKLANKGLITDSTS
jgi:hypothetical protein